MFDRAALKDAFMGHHAVVNLATAIPPTSKFMQTKMWADNDRVRTEGSGAIVDAAIEAGVSRVVQESVSMLYRDRGDAWIDEDPPWAAICPSAREGWMATAKALKQRQA